MYINKHADLADKCWGDTYYSIVPSLINRFNYKIFAEIGVAFGGHLERILQTTKIEKAYGIDPYKLFDSSTDSFFWEGRPYDQNDYDNLFRYTNDRLSKFTNVELIRKSSEESANIFGNGSIDIVFIDGEHTYSGVTNDINIWENKVKSDGIISGHDYNHPNFPDVKKVVDKWASQNKYSLNIENGYVWWVKKSTF